MYNYIKFTKKYCREKFKKLEMSLSARTSKFDSRAVRAAVNSRPDKLRISADMKTSLPRNENESKSAWIYESVRRSFASSCNFRGIKWPPFWLLIPDISLLFLVYFVYLVFYCDWIASYREAGRKENNSNFSSRYNFFFFKYFCFLFLKGV